jgi:hypothetical protein
VLKSGIPIGKLFGISLRLHYSWFFIFALITWALAANYFPSTQPSWSLSMKIGAGRYSNTIHNAVYTRGCLSDDRRTQNSQG